MLVPDIEGHGVITGRANQPLTFYPVHKFVLTSVISIHDQLSTILHETAGVQNPSL